MTIFETRRLDDAPVVLAPDGSVVRVLPALVGGSAAHFELAPGCTSRAVSHKAVEEVWYFLSGYGEFWRKLGSEEKTVSVEAGTCLTVPAGTAFQFRALGDEPLAAFGVTMPPWQDGEALDASGPWEPKLP
jgi:mannose-6-phosphate isomerase-like protein (cupin superfamily)